MQLVIPFAAPASEAGRAAMAKLAWPGLARLLAGRSASLDPGEETSLSPPHERALARAWGWTGGDGALPFAAHAAQADGISIDQRPVALVTPAHWHLGTEQVSMTDPESLTLAEADARTLFDAVRPLFVDEGFALHFGRALRWYLQHESLASMPIASLDRVIGRNVDRWLPAGREARLLRRLQNEVQMLLHRHPLNAVRESRGLPPVNSIWISGCGAAQPAAGEVRVDDRLRRAALAEDWDGWAASWRLLDHELAAAPPALLTLCGERASATWTLGALPLLKRLKSSFARADLAALLEGL